MTNVNVNKKSNVETKSNEPEIKYAERNEPWRKQPSVLKGSSYKVGDGEEDFVD